MQAIEHVARGDQACDAAVFEDVLDLTRAVTLVDDDDDALVVLLAVLVALVKLNDLATVLPGPGLAAFTAMVVFTILASQSFDPKLLWERDER